MVGLVLFFVKVVTFKGNTEENQSKRGGCVSVGDKTKDCGI